MLSVIFLNAIVLFALSFNLPYSSIIWLEVLDIIFLFYFVLEALFKIREDGWAGYIGEAWNKFDFILLVISLPSVLTLLQGGLPDPSVFFVFRVARVVRFFKFLRFIPNIQELIAGIRRAFKASIFVLLAFFIYGFVVSLISYRIYAPYEPELFGNALRSFYSMFKVFTIEGWYDIPEKIIAGEYKPMTATGIFFTKMYFILIVGTGGLFGLSIVNAIFVEEMVRDNNDELEAKVRTMDKKMDRILEMLKKEEKNSAKDNQNPS